MSEILLWLGAICLGAGTTFKFAVGAKEGVGIGNLLLGCALCLHFLGGWLSL